jgi:hypothetical protein
VIKSEREMKEMVKNLEKYVKKKKLQMMVFNKRKRKSEENECKWDGREIQRLSEFKYLGYTFNKRTTDKFGE